MDDMDAGCGIDDIGIQVMVGQSLIGAGRGLFLSILDEVEKVTLPAGTPICGYSKGEFTDEADGDKAVAYAFNTPIIGVLFEKELMPLLDAISIIEQRINNATSTISAFKSINKRRKNNFHIADSVLGHSITFNDSNKEIEIKPKYDYFERYFIPFEQSDNDEWGPGRLGMYANDLAYYEG